MFDRKEAQKCYCETAICRGWLGDEPDEDDEEEDEDDEEEQEDLKKEAKITEDVNKEVVKEVAVKEEGQSVEINEKPVKKERRRSLRQRKQRKDMFEDLDVSKPQENCLTGYCFYIFCSWMKK